MCLQVALSHTMESIIYFHYVLYLCYFFHGQIKFSRRISLIYKTQEKKHGTMCDVWILESVRLGLDPGSTTDDPNDYMFGSLICTMERIIIIQF